MEFYEKVNRIAKTEKGELRGFREIFHSIRYLKGFLMQKPQLESSAGESRRKQKSGKAFIMQIISDRLRRRCATRKAVCMVMNFSSPQKI